MLSGWAHACFINVRFMQQSRLLFLALMLAHIKTLGPPLSSFINYTEVLRQYSLADLKVSSILTMT